jgi:redox-sensing transcriptional repressor
MRYGRIPDETIRRLSTYMRGLVGLFHEGIEKVSSTALAEALHMNPPQIRKDLSYFGAFGTPGVGYEVEKLLNHIKDILKLNNTHSTALVGFGNLGSALLKYPGFSPYGLDIVAVFDDDSAKIGKKINGIEVEDVSRIKDLEKREIRLAILAVPANAAQETTDKLVEAGVRGVLNFAPLYLKVPKKVKVITIDIATDLARLPYYLPAG